jgi:hypothetical protein
VRKERGPCTTNPLPFFFFPGKFTASYLKVSLHHTCGWSAAPNLKAVQPGCSRVPLSLRVSRSRRQFYTLPRDDLHASSKDHVDRMLGSRHVSTLSGLTLLLYLYPPGADRNDMGLHLKNMSSIQV